MLTIFEKDNPIQILDGELEDGIFHVLARVYIPASSIWKRAPENRRESRRLFINFEDGENPSIVSKQLIKELRLPANFRGTITSTLAKCNH